MIISAACLPLPQPLNKLQFAPSLSPKAMAFPGEGLEKIYRNNCSDVASMLKENYPNAFKIYNLSERKYDYSKFDNQVVEYGFPDHHSPPMDYLFHVCRSMDDWLSLNPDNVAVVHCLVK